MKKITIILCLLAFKTMGQEMGNSKKLNKVSKKEVKAILNKQNGILDSEFKKKYYIELYILNSNKALMDFESHGFMFESKSEALNYIEKINQKTQTGSTNSILENIYKFDLSFLERIKDIERELFNNIKINEVEYSDKELRYIDEEINKLLKKGVTADILFPLLVAYSGEYIKAKTDQSRWILIEESFSKRFEPHLVDRNGHVYNPAYIVYKELYEYYPAEGKISLFDHIQIELLHYNIKIGGK
jgi:hypothetical protein